MKKIKRQAANRSREKDRKKRKDEHGKQDNAGTMGTGEKKREHQRNE